MREDKFFLGFLMSEINSQLNPGKKEISLFKTFFSCETTSLQVRRELPLARASHPTPPITIPTCPQSCLDL